MLISLIMQIAQSMQISIRHFLTPQTMYITFPLKNLAVKNIFGLVCLASGLILLNMVTEKIEENINLNQFGGMGGASTTDVLFEMIHRWSEATDKLDHYVRVALLDFSKAIGGKIGVGGSVLIWKRNIVDKERITTD